MPTQEASEEDSISHLSIDPPPEPESEVVSVSLESRAPTKGVAPSPAPLLLVRNETPVVLEPHKVAPRRVAPLIKAQKSQKNKAPPPKEYFSRTVFLLIFISILIAWTLATHFYQEMKTPAVFTPGGSGSLAQWKKTLLSTLDAEDRGIQKILGKLASELDHGILLENGHWATFMGRLTETDPKLTHLLKGSMLFIQYWTPENILIIRKRLQVELNPEAEISVSPPHEAYALLRYRKPELPPNRIGIDYWVHPEFRIAAKAVLQSGIRSYLVKSANPMQDMDPFDPARFSVLFPVPDKNVSGFTAGKFVGWLLVTLPYEDYLPGALARGSQVRVDLYMGTEPIESKRVYTNGFESSSFSQKIVEHLNFFGERATLVLQNP